LPATKNLALQLMLCTSLRRSDGVQIGPRVGSPRCPQERTCSSGSVLFAVVLMLYRPATGEHRPSLGEATQVLKRYSPLSR
jgi:hypothetical protein